MTVISYTQSKIGPFPKRKFKFVVGGFVAVASILVLIVNGLMSAGNY